jgi:hypothetical protein
MATQSGRAPCKMRASLDNGNNTFNRTRLSFYSARSPVLEFVIDYSRGLSLTWEKGVAKSGSGKRVKTALPNIVHRYERSMMIVLFHVFSLRTLSVMLGVEI